MFPTEVRATAVGVAIAISRIGVVVSTYGLPLFLAAYGIGPTMLTGAGLLIVALVLSVFMAPETRGLTLGEASSLRPNERNPVADFDAIVVGSGCAGPVAAYELAKAGKECPRRRARQLLRRQERLRRAALHPQPARGLSRLRRSRHRWNGGSPASG